MTHSGPLNDEDHHGSRQRSQHADLQTVMRSIDDSLIDLIAEDPDYYQPLVPNALLNLATERILEAEGPIVTARILQRLAELIRSGAHPEGDTAFRLTGNDA
jgi:hypothetical protein